MFLLSPIPPSEGLADGGESAFYNNYNYNISIKICATLV